MATADTVRSWPPKAQSPPAQTFVSEKSNEITAIPLLLDLLDVKGKTITIEYRAAETKYEQQV